MSELKITLLTLFWLFDTPGQEHKFIVFKAQTPQENLKSNEAQPSKISYLSAAEIKTNEFPKVKIAIKCMQLWIIDVIHILFLEQAINCLASRKWYNIYTIFSKNDYNIYEDISFIYENVTLLLYTKLRIHGNLPLQLQGFTMLAFFSLGRNRKIKNMGLI